MVVLVFTDLRERILPDVVNFTGFGAGPGSQFFHPPADGTALWIATRLRFSAADAGAFVCRRAVWRGIGSGLLWLVSEGYFRLRGREGMGLGDVKMMLWPARFWD